MKSSTMISASKLLLLFSIGNVVQASTDCINGIPFLVHGDWGEAGENQTKIANEMNNWSLANQASFLVALGDNFYYNGVVSTTDPQWNRTYRHVYTQPGLQIPWYVVLGNHDYHSNPHAQIEYSEQHLDNRWTLPDYLYSKRFPLPTQSFNSNTTSTNCGFTGDVPCYLEIIFINTPTLSPLETRETRPEGKHAVSTAMLNEYLANLEGMLQASEATWLIVAGHYTIYSMADHGDNAELICRLVPLLEKYGVQLYFNGHDHVLQHISWQGIEYVTSGHGAYTNHFPDAVFNEERGSIAEAGVRFASLRPGFTTVCATAEQGLTMHMIDVDGQDLYVHALVNPRWTNTLQYIQKANSKSPATSTSSVWDAIYRIFFGTHTNICDRCDTDSSATTAVKWAVLMLLLVFCAGSILGAACVFGCCMLVFRTNKANAPTSLYTYLQQNISIRRNKTGRKTGAPSLSVQGLLHRLSPWSPLPNNSSHHSSSLRSDDGQDIELRSHSDDCLLSSLDDRDHDDEPDHVDIEAASVPTSSGDVRNSQPKTSSNMSTNHTAKKTSRISLVPEYKGIRNNNSNGDDDHDEFQATAAFVREIQASSAYHQDSSSRQRHGSGGQTSLHQAPVHVQQRYAKLLKEEKQKQKQKQQILRNSAQEEESRIDSSNSDRDHYTSGDSSSYSSSKQQQQVMFREEDDSEADRL